MVDLLKKYIENRLQLVKLELVSVLANLTAGLISSFLILLMGLGVLFIFSIALAYWIGQYYDNVALGFAILGGIYVLIFILYFVFLKNTIDTKVKDKIVKAALAAEDELLDD